MTAVTSDDRSEQDVERSDIEKATDRSFIWGTGILAIAVAAVLLWIAVQVATEAMPAIQTIGLDFLTRSTWDPVDDIYGILPAIYGTLISSLIAILLALPIGLACAIVLSENFLPISIRTPLTFLIELLAAIPSVVYGLWGIYVLIPFIEPLGNWLHDSFGWFPLFSTPYQGPGMLPAGVVLAIMILPILTVIARDSLAALPTNLRWGSYGIGATRWRTIFSVLIPAAFSGIVGGIMLALGRALGETMAVTLVIGNSTDLNFSILAPSVTISSLLASQFAEASGLQEDALFYAGLVLFAITLIVNILAEFIVLRVKKF
ncbi:phosphate ABC transporter permease subunit PstC [Gloeocapsa sp. BRSZ]